MCSSSSFQSLPSAQSPVLFFFLLLSVFCTQASPHLHVCISSGDNSSVFSSVMLWRDSERCGKRAKYQWYPYIRPRGKLLQKNTSPVSSVIRLFFRISCEPIRFYFFFYDVTRYFAEHQCRKCEITRKEIGFFPEAQSRRSLKVSFQRKLS